jgi:hypothetical protein
VIKGFGLLSLASPVMALLYSALTDSRQQQLKMLDRRVRLTTEVLSTVRQIKLYAYETYFGDRIGEYREKELARLRKRGRSSASLTMLMASPDVKNFHTGRLITDTLTPGSSADFGSRSIVRHVLAIRP